MNYILQFIYSMWVLVLLLSCTSKKDSNIQATIDSLFIYDNHPTLKIPETNHLQWVDSVLGVKGVKLIDYRNGIYQYDVSNQPPPSCDGYKQKEMSVS